MAVVDSLPPLRVYNLKDSSEYVEHGIETRIKALSGGLIEVRAHGSGTVVQVSHQTVRDFLLEEGFETLTDSKVSSSSEKHTEGLCHNILAISCINYLWTEDVQQLPSKLIWDQLQTSNTPPLLQHAVSAFFWHASNAEKNGYHQERLLEQFNYRYTHRTFKDDVLDQGVFSLWRSAGITYCLRNYFGVLPSASSTLLHIASMANIQTVVKILLKKGVKIYEKDKLGQQVIHYAARGGATEVAVILIKYSSSVINAKDNNSTTPIQRAARHYKSDVMRLLITNGAKTKYLNEGNSWKLKEAGEDVEKTVSLLLEDAAKFNALSLQSVARSGDLGAVQLLLAEGTDVNAQGGHYGSALVAAVHNGNDAVVRVLLEKGAEINAQDGEYGCALVAAVHNGDENMIDMLLRRSAEINARGGEYANALAAAAERCNLASINTLLEMGAEINATGGIYGNALMTSSYNGHEAVVKVLLERGADVNFHSGEFSTALTAAAYNSHVGVVNLLLNRGVDISYKGGVYGNALIAAVNNGKKELVLLLLMRGAETNTPHGQYTNALALASRDNGLAIVRDLLLDGKAEFDQFLAVISNYDLNYLLQSLKVVLLVASLVGRLDIVEGVLEFLEQDRQPQNLKTLIGFKSLILGRERLNASIGKKLAQYDGYTALQLAATASHLGVVDRLLMAGAQVDIIAAPNGGRMALQAAAGTGNLLIVQRLLDDGASVNDPVAEIDGSTALQAAAEHGHLRTVEKLLDAGADVNAANFDGRGGGTALGAAARNGHLDVVTRTSKVLGISHTHHFKKAAEFGHLEIVETLLTAGAVANFASSSYRGATALQEAAERDYSKIVERLLFYGADTNATGDKHFRCTALQSAVINGNLKMVAQLIHAGADVNAEAALSGGPALCDAARTGDLEMVRILVAAGADVNSSAD
ncbi:hypothetical protein VE02_06197 [Pseudogymnoascus sp. 03VT05]|nr:hypothetical protein VE02_06197 [Pseudogymnoascus sp. 03VT05]